MAKYVKKEDRPTVDAIQVQWNINRDAYIPSGSWVIKHSDGSTTFCSDEWFKSHFMKAE